MSPVASWPHTVYMEQETLEHYPEHKLSWEHGGGDSDMDCRDPRPVLLWPYDQGLHFLPLNCYLPRAKALGLQFDKEEALISLPQNFTEIIKESLKMCKAITQREGRERETSVDKRSQGISGRCRLVEEVCMTGRRDKRES